MSCTSPFIDRSQEILVEYTIFLFLFDSTYFPKHILLRIKIELLLNWLYFCFFISFFSSLSLFFSLLLNRILSIFDLFFGIYLNLLYSIVNFYLKYNNSNTYQYHQKLKQISLRIFYMFFFFLYKYITLFHIFYSFFSY